MSVKSLINFWKSQLANNQSLMPPSMIALVKETIAELESLQKLRNRLAQDGIEILFHQKRK